VGKQRIVNTDRSLVRTQWSLKAIGADKVHAAHPRLAPVRVGVIDTGIDLQQPDIRHFWHNPSPTPAPFSSRIVPRGAPGWDLLRNDAIPDDTGGHGTVVSGLLAAQVGNGTGIDGVAPNARLMALRACSKNPRSEIVCEDSSYAAAMDWAASHGARVVHMSWSLGGGPAIAAVVAAHPEVLFVTATDNGSGSNIDAGPLAHNCKLPSPNLICVAGSNRIDARMSCSSIGPVSVDLAAPGVKLTVALRRARYLVGSPCAVTFAAPHVSGAAAVLFGAVPDADPAAVKAALLDGARRVPGFAGLTVSGGILNVANSLRILRARYP
jgi:thermitase